MAKLSKASQEELREVLRQIDRAETAVESGDHKDYTLTQVKRAGEMLASYLVKH